jgi:mannose-6-phosphate isomerase-like protein (cupin superfamily)
MATPFSRFAAIRVASLDRLHDGRYQRDARGHDALRGDTHPIKGGRRMLRTDTTRIAIEPEEGESFDCGNLGAVWKIESEETGGRFSVVEHPLPPRSLAAPLHLHHKEDEYSYVLEGTLGAVLGDEVIETGPGSWVFKPREQWHTFWNAGDTPCRIIEVFSPAGFENYFRYVAEIYKESTDSRPDLARFARANERYELEMDFNSVRALCERFGLVHPMA